MSNSIISEGVKINLKKEKWYEV